MSHWRKLSTMPENERVLVEAFREGWEEGGVHYVVCIKDLSSGSPVFWVMGAARADHKLDTCKPIRWKPIT